MSENLSGREPGNPPARVADSPTDYLPHDNMKPVYVNRMFARIAPTYDLMNRLMTGAQDGQLRRVALALTNLPPRGRLLDVGTGTGDLAHMAREADRTQARGIWTVGVDFTYEMMAQGQRNAKRCTLPFVQGDTYCLPFADNTFDAVVSGFLLRNVVDREAAFREQSRVTKPGGRVVCLETTPPEQMLFGPLFQFYFFRVVPLLGRLVSGDPHAYAYLPHSTVNFPDPAQLTRMMERVGLHDVFYVQKLFGAIAIHVGTKVGK